MFLIFLLPFLVVFGCSQEKASTDPPNPDVVASFNGGVITKDQVNAKFEGLMPCCKDRYRGEEGRRELIKEMVLPVVISRTIKQKRIDIRENIREELGNLQDELNMSFLHIKFHEQILSSNEEYVDLKKSYEFQKKRLEGFPLSERRRVSVIRTVSKTRSAPSEDSPSYRRRCRSGCAGLYSKNAS
jgi:hypothetical protein